MSNHFRESMVPSNGLQYCFRDNGTVERWNVIGTHLKYGVVVVDPSGCEVGTIASLVEMGDIREGVVMPASASPSIIDAALKRRGL